MNAEFQRKEEAPHAWLVVYWRDEEGKAYERLRDQLRQIGWDDDGMRGLPPIDGENQITLVCHGSGLFGGQTKAEASKFVAQCRKVLENFDIRAGRVQTLPWQEFL